MRFRFSIIIKLIAASVIVVLLICTFIISSCTIPSIGMENSLYKGERVLVNKWSYGFRIPFTTMRILGSTAKRGDFVLFNNPNPVKWTDPIWMRESYIGQIAGIPGDVLRIDANLNLQDEHVLSPQRIRLYNYPCEQDSLLKQMIDIQNVPDRGLSAYDNGFFMRLFTISEAKRIQSQAAVVLIKSHNALFKLIFKPGIPTFFGRMGSNEQNVCAARHIGTDQGCIKVLNGIGAEQLGIQLLRHGGFILL